MLARLAPPSAMVSLRTHPDSYQLPLQNLLASAYWESEPKPAPVIYLLISSQILVQNTSPELRRLESRVGLKWLVLD